VVTLIKLEPTEPIPMEIESMNGERDIGNESEEEMCEDSEEGQQLPSSKSSDVGSPGNSSLNFPFVFKKQ
jgi:hypothetical protein